MRQALCVLVLCAAGQAATAQYDLLWDNGDWLWHGNLTSERNTMVTESWTVDDMILAEPVIVREFEWTSIMRKDMNALGADLIILDEGFQTLHELWDFGFNAEYRGDVYGEFENYRVTLSGLEIELAPGRYFIGGRMVGDGASRAVSGLNFTELGEDRAHWKSEFYGQPDWVRWELDYELAFRVYGDIIPAPGTLAVGLAAFAFVRRRRAHGPKPGRR